MLGEFFKVLLKFHKQFLPVPIALLLVGNGTAKSLTIFGVSFGN